MRHYENSNLPDESSELVMHRKNVARKALELGDLHMNSEHHEQEVEVEEEMKDNKNNMSQMGD